MDPEEGSRPEVLTAEQAAALLRRQALLQREAAAILAGFGLPDRLRALGRAAVIGSAALGLMVWRDIDVLVAAPGLDVADAFAALHPLITDPRLTQLRFLNQIGHGDRFALRDESTDAVSEVVGDRRGAVVAHLS